MLQQGLQQKSVFVVGGERSTVPSDVIVTGNNGNEHSLLGFGGRYPSALLHASHKYLINTLLE